VLEKSSTPPEQPAAKAAPAPEEPAPRRRRKHPVLRVLGVLAALVAAGLATLVTVDLGPVVRARAEDAASKYIERPVHIGKLKVRLLTGAFEVDDLMIEGLAPTDRPFLRAKRVFVNMPWWSIIHRELVISDVDMTDWNMLIEQFPNGRHNFPKFKHEDKEPKPTGPKRFTTTVKYVIARNGMFTFEDHGTPWGVICRNLNVTVFRSFDTYRGTAQFSDGTVRIQSYDPFRADMQTRFKIQDGKVLLDHIDLQSTGATTKVDGVVDLGHWPEMLYNVRSRVDFPIQKGIFFKGMNFTVAGQGDFQGTFHFYKGGRELKGTFTSPEAGVNAWRFPRVQGSLLWIPSKFQVTDVTSGLYGGNAKFSYVMGPFGQLRPATAVWDAAYTNVDLTQLTDFAELQGIRLSGRISGKNRLEWPLGKFSEKHGSGEVTAVMPPGAAPMTKQLQPDQIARVDPLPPEQGPFNAHLPIGHVPVAGTIAYTLDPAWITIPNGWAATDKTYVEFNGRTAWAKHSRLPFHVTSLDWQESDRVLAGIMTTFGAATGAISIGGRGEFDGTMTEAFSDPRIEGHFTGDRMRAWDVTWGHAAADLVIQNGYVFISNSSIRDGDSEINAEGKFSLGYPRKDRGEEINASIKINRRPLLDLRHAFLLDDYPLDGVVSGEYHIYGMYLTPDGYGRLQIDQGKAYGEAFDVATANLRFEGSGQPGVRLEGIDLKKSTGRLTGAAWVAWDGTYSFDASGTRIPVESLVTLSVPRAPLSGLMQFTATGSGAFESPRYDVKLGVADLFAGDEGIGQVTGRLSMRNQMLTMEIDAQSPRLSVTGSGRLALTPEMDAEATLHFNDTSLDPYLRFLQPTLSPYTRAVADGTIHVAGELADIDHLAVEMTVDKLALTLFDYPAHNDGPIQLALNQHRLDVQHFRLAGDGTALQVSGDVGLHDNTIAIDASGDANLSILQGFFHGDVRSSGNATLRAQVRGALDKPVFSGSATLSDGRFRYVVLPHSLQSINGELTFDAQGIRVADVTADLGGGKVQIGGRIGLNGFQLGNLDLTATGDQMHLRYPEGFRSTVDAQFALRGPLSSPVLSGTVLVRDGRYEKPLQTTVDIFNLSPGPALPSPVAAPSTFPLRLDIRVQAPHSLRVENNTMRLTGSADLTVTGTYEKPQLFGRAEIERGEIFFEGNRYIVTRGTIDFYNPSRIEPFFDVEAETRIRVPAPADETYRVTVGASGSLGGKLSASFNSDPPLSFVDIASLIFGQASDLSNPELRALHQQSVTQSEEQLLRAGVLRLLAAPIYAPALHAIESSLNTTVLLAPGLGTESDPLAPTARLIIGKRLSDRAYLTFSRALGTTVREQILVLEYDQSDRVGWILTQSGDRTFSVDFRVRHVF
jgi:translocation-and-assembly-module (TAM) inner membrane subunit TamB-like protein